MFRMTDMFQQMRSRPGLAKLLESTTSAVASESRSGMPNKASASGAQQGAVVLVATAAYGEEDDEIEPGDAGRPVGT